MKQRSITYSRHVTVTTPDDCSMDNEELVNAVDNSSEKELDEFGISLVEDVSTGFTGYVTNIQEGT